MLDARMDIARGDKGAIDRLVAIYRGPPTEQPALLYSPPIDWRASQDRKATLLRSTVAQNRAEAVNAARFDQWIDVGFRVGADGRVRDVDVLRRSTEKTTDWVEPVLAQIRGRRYAPLAVAPGSVSALRVERHTYTAAWGSVTGGGIRRQTGDPQVVVTDLTIEPEPRADGSRPTVSSSSREPPARSSGPMAMH